MLFAITRHHCLSILTASAVAGIALLGALEAPDAGTAAVPQPDHVIAQRSTSGKIVDRLPGSAQITPRLAKIVTQAEWSVASASDGEIAFASVIGSDIGGTGQATAEPVLIAVASPAPEKPVHPATRSRKAAAVIAALPPQRPAALDMPQPVVAVAASEKRLSAAARMIAFVGSLTALARPL